MPRKDKRVGRRTILGLGGAAAGTLFAGQTLGGSLEPPLGPPSPSGRSLKEVEPRVAVNGMTGDGTAHHVIDTGGSYKLTGNIMVAGGIGIRVASLEPVSIDLNGFAIDGQGSGGGIIVDNAGGLCPYVEIFDGYIRNLGGDGINGGSARVLEVNDVHIENVLHGIVGVGSMTIEGCVIKLTQSDAVVWNRNPMDPAVFILNDSEIIHSVGSGVLFGGDWSFGANTAIITDTDFLECSADGITMILSHSAQGDGQLSVSIQDVRASSNGSYGLRLQCLTGPTGTARLSVQCEDVVCTGNSQGGMRLSDHFIDLIDCVCSDNNGDGFTLENTQGSIDNCMALRNSTDGVRLLGTSSKMSVSEVASHSNLGAGIRLDNGVTGTPVQDCDVRNQPSGMVVVGPNNLLLRNTATGNGANYTLGASTAVILTPAQIATSSNPHANYSFP